MILIFLVLPGILTYAILANDVFKDWSWKNSMSTLRNFLLTIYTTMILNTTIIKRVAGESNTFTNLGLNPALYSLKSLVILIGLSIIWGVLGILLQKKIMSKIQVYIVKEERS